MVTCVIFSFLLKAESWSKKWHSTPVFLLGKFHEQGSLTGYSPWGHKELDMTGQLTLHFRESDLPGWTPFVAPIS